MDVHFLESRSGISFAMDVGCWDTVLTVKQNIARKQGIPVGKQTLKYKGQVLLDDQYLEGNQLELVVAADPLEPPEPPLQFTDQDLLDGDDDDDLFSFGFGIEPPVICPGYNVDKMRPQPALSALTPPLLFISTVPPVTERLPVAAPIGSTGDQSLFEEYRTDSIRDGD